MRWRDVEDPKAFDDYMESVDARLRADGVDIASRPLHAFGLISEELKISFTGSSSVATRINGWFEQRYGSRLGIDWSPGSMLIQVRGDPYAVRYPRIFGSVQVNPFSWVQHAAPRLFDGIAHPELLELANIIVSGLNAFMLLESVPQPPAHDLASAVSHVLARPADPGLSKWGSQQAVEKMLNGFVAAFGGDPRSRRRKGVGIHDLLPMVELAEAHQLPTLDRTLLARVECSADVRYPGRVAVSLDEAVAANQAAVLLCGAIAERWPK